MIHYSIAKTAFDLHEILTLQKNNLTQNLSKEEARIQGFVTVSHPYDLLAEMNAQRPHIIAKYDEKVIAYALVMLEMFKDRIPVLIPMFDQIKTLKWKGKSMLEISFFIMGQVCIEKSFRGQGIFSGLFQKMKQEMSKDFEMVVTEVATRNIRSIKAHEKVGFKTIKKFQVEQGEEWAIIGWDWQ